MAFPNRLNDPEDTPVVQIKSFEKHPRCAAGWRTIFVGPKGLRAGWRLLVFFILCGAMFALLYFIVGGRRPDGLVITPFLLGRSDAILFLIVCIATLIMSKVEHRQFREYGLAPGQALRKEFWIGWLFGFSAISGTLLTMFLLHGFRVTGLAIHGRSILPSLIGWGIAFLLVALFEEFALRGYVQYTLASGVGFWPAAFVVSGLFGIAHAFNPGENRIGLLAVVMFGLLLCLFLRGTGTLWCAVGFHAAYDWGQTFFYGVPDSGMMPYHNLLSSTFSGPRWLTGSTVGPEASLLTPIALLIVALVFSHYYRENRYPQP